RQPETCGQCHMGPDHSQLEIFQESKHGVLYHAQSGHMNLAAPPGKLTTADMPVPTCSTCHMSGLEGLTTTHDTSERLSYWLFATVSDRRPDFRSAQANMKAVCLKCHTSPRILKFYGEAERVIHSTNNLVEEADGIVKALRAEGRLTDKPFDEPIEYLYFDLWHYGGRTAKHGAFMGGADFVQWHGYYEIVSKLTELKRQAEELRREAKPAESAQAQAADAAPAPAQTETKPAEPTPTPAPTPAPAQTETKAAAPAPAPADESAPAGARPEAETSESGAAPR
ncbi:MAG TPA: multiheme c-type cytochrome, partial [Isosphaeraceae bacterium]